MSRQNLIDSDTGKDPQVFAENVRIYRLGFGWSMRQLARESKVGINTLTRIEHGKGCSFATENKLCNAFQTYPGRLWQKQHSGYAILHKSTEDRWALGSEADVMQYWKRHELLGEENNHRSDPDQIQDAEERMRLGRTGLVTVFMRSTRAHLNAGIVRSRIFEFYKENVESKLRGIVRYAYCLRGTIEIIDGDASFTLSEGDVLVAEMRNDWTFRPLQLNQEESFPAILLSVDLDNSLSPSK